MNQRQEVWGADGGLSAEVLDRIASQAAMAGGLLVGAGYQVLTGQCQVILPEPGEAAPAPPPTGGTFSLLVGEIFSSSGGLIPGATYRPVDEIYVEITDGLRVENLGAERVRIWLTPATPTQRGSVSTVLQRWAGLKQFNNGIDTYDRLRWAVGPETGFDDDIIASRIDGLTVQSLDVGLRLDVRDGSNPTCRQDLLVYAGQVQRRLWNPTSHPVSGGSEMAGSPYLGIFEAIESGEFGNVRWRAAFASQDGVTSNTLAGTANASESVWQLFCRNPAHPTDSVMRLRVSRLSPLPGSTCEARLTLQAPAASGGLQVLGSADAGASVWTLGAASLPGGTAPSLMFTCASINGLTTSAVDGLAGVTGLIPNGTLCRAGLVVGYTSPPGGGGGTRDVAFSAY